MPFEMYKPLKDREYEKPNVGLTVASDGQEEILYLYAYIEVLHSCAFLSPAVVYCPEQIL
jgi:hypothetical protein